MAINEPIKKRELKKFITTMNKAGLRISGWYKTYDDIQEYIFQKENGNPFCNDTEIPDDN